MDQQNEELGSSAPSNVPIKRKRDRPRKETCVVQENHISAMDGSADVSNSNQAAPTTDGYQRRMVGKLILGVIEGTFDGGYLIKVQVADTDLKGVVFLPGQVVPVTAENDVVQHVRIIERNDVQILVLNPVTPNPMTQVHSNYASSRKRSKQPFQSALQVPMPISQVRPTELQSDVSVSLENQYASVVAPMANFLKVDSSVSARGQAKESTTDGGATKDSKFMKLSTWFQQLKTLRRNP